MRTARQLEADMYDLEIHIKHLTDDFLTKLERLDKLEEKLENDTRN